MTSRPPSRPEADRAKERLESFVSKLSHGAAPRGTFDPATADLFDAFSAAGVDVLLLKGPALAHFLYSTDETRAYSDLDILVDPAGIDGATDVLAQLGYRNATARLGIVDVDHVVHGDTWLPPTERGNREVDVHRWLPGAEAPEDEAWTALWRSRTTIELSDRPIPVLAREGQALHLATHAAQHGPGYTKGIVELRLAIERWPHDVWESAAALAGETGALRAFAAGLRLAPEGVQVAAELGLPADSEREWEVAHRGERPRGASHVAALGRSRTLGERLELLRRALFPTRRWIEVEYAWAQRGSIQLVAAYAVHLVRTPVWAARAAVYARRARRAEQK